MSPRQSFAALRGIFAFSSGEWTMIALLGTPIAPKSKRWQRLGEVATAVGWIVLALAIGSLFVGHSSSPYGVCYAASGRSVPCAVVVRP